jgi:deoxyadenosine/deoxycytidine kinase
MASRHFVIVSGNIAVGKSTLASQLMTSLGWKAYFEAFAENPYLTDFYQDMHTWSFHSQVYFLARRLQHHHEIAMHPSHVVQDRSVYEDAEIFAKNLYLQGNMSERDHGCYQALYEGIRAFLPMPSLVVYLYAPVGVLAERIAQRGRQYERQISIEYLLRVNTLYEAWSTQWTASPLLRIPAAEYDFAHDLDALNEVIQQILSALDAQAEN